MGSKKNNRRRTNNKTVREEEQNKQAKQLQKRAQSTVLEDTENWIACDKCTKWRKSDRLGAYQVTCKKINRRCEEVADDMLMEESGEEKAWEKARLSQEEWIEQIKKWKEKYNSVTKE